MRILSAVSAWKRWSASASTSPRRREARKLAPVAADNFATRAPRCTRLGTGGLAAGGSGMPLFCPRACPPRTMPSRVVDHQATLLAVADSHNGSRPLTPRCGRCSTASAPSRRLTDLLFQASEVVVPRPPCSRRPNANSRTTLALVLISCGGVRQLQWASSIGDSAVFVATPATGRELSDPMPRAELAGSAPAPGSWSRATGSRTSSAHVSPGASCRRARCIAGRVVSPGVLSGLIRYVPRAGDTAVTLAVRAVIDCANARGAGDNIAVAVAAPCET